MSNNSSTSQRLKGVYLRGKKFWYRYSYEGYQYRIPLDEKKVGGPIWVRGGIPVVAADGKTYKVWNRVTLCRCGRSSNKPFCDGSHAG